MANVIDNIWARLKAARAGQAIGNTYALYDDAGFLAAQATGPGSVRYVDTINGDDNNDGSSWSQAFATMGAAFDVVENFDVIYFAGVVREQLVAPQDVFDVTIVGAANTPRQATESSVPTGAGSTWLAPTSPTATTPLLKLREQGWTLVNFFMAADTDAACVYLDRQEIAAAQDASHFASFGMVYGGGLIGIQDNGGNAFLQLYGNRFQNLVQATSYAIKVGGSLIANPLQWQVVGNLFRNNKNHILAPTSQAEFKGNDFGIVGNSITAVIALSLTGGLNNTVVENYLNRPQNTSPNATLYVGGTNDLWYQNFGTDAVIYGVPDNS